MTAGNPDSNVERFARSLGFKIRIVGLGLLVFLAYPLSVWPDTPIRAYIALAAFTWAYAIVILRNTPHPHRNQAPVPLAVATAAGGTAAQDLGSQWALGLGFYIVVMVFINFRRMWHPSLLLLVATATLLLQLLVLENPLDATLPGLVTLLFIGGIQIAAYRAIQTEIKLQMERRETERLAVLNERLRISRDIHDIVGQFLSGVILRAERLAQSQDDIRREMTELAESSRHTLELMRSAVSGYRTTNLTQELRVATSLAEVAGVDLEVEIDASLPPEHLNEITGVIVREGITNILRHARATTGKVTVTSGGDRLRVCISDDGLGSRSAAHAWGNGLRGLSERVEKLGGELAAGPEGGHFVLRASLPMGSPKPTRRRVARWRAFDVDRSETGADPAPHPS